MIRPRMVRRRAANEGTAPRCESYAHCGGRRSSCGLLWVLTIPATVPPAALPPHTRISITAGPCSTSGATRPATPPRTRMPRKSTAPGSAAGLLCNRRSALLRAEHLARSRRGIGSWSEADFVTALWKGTSPHGRHLFPAFQYTSYQHMELADVRDRLPLKTLPPVSRRARRHDLAFPSMSAAWSDCGRCCISTAGRFDAILRNRRNGFAALIWSTAPALRQMPQPAQFSRRRRRQRALCRRAQSGWQGLGAEITPVGLPALVERGYRLVGERHRQLPRRRHESGRRFRWRRDGRTIRNTSKLDAPTARRSPPTSSRCRRGRARSRHRRNDISVLDWPDGSGVRNSCTVRKAPRILDFSSLASRRSFATSPTATSAARPRPRLIATWRRCATAMMA